MTKRRQEERKKNPRYGKIEKKDHDTQKMHKRLQAKKKRSNREREIESKTVVKHLEMIGRAGKDADWGILRDHSWPKPNVSSTAMDNFCCSCSYDV